VLRSVRRRLAVRVMRNSRADCRVDRAFPAGGFMAKDGVIGAHSLLDADSGWCPKLPSAERQRFTMVDLLRFVTGPSL